MVDREQIDEVLEWQLKTSSPKLATPISKMLVLRLLLRIPIRFIIVPIREIEGSEDLTYIVKEMGLLICSQCLERSPKLLELPSRFTPGCYAG